MAPPLLTLQDIHLTFGGTPLLEGAELSINKGERLCLVGRNGSGKSTLMKIAAGSVEADQGKRFIRPGVTLRYLSQEPDLTDFATVLDYVEAGLGPGDDPHRARYLLEQLGLSGAEPPARLSGGENRRAALARVLAPAPDILLLDEPTNHLDLPAIEWLEKELGNQRSAMVLISHDRRFLENLSNATLWLDRGVTRQIGKGFAHFEAWRDDTLAQEEDERHKLDRKIVREEHWIRYGVTARRKRNQRRLQALHDLRQQRRDQRQATGNVNMTLTQAEASGKLVVEAKGIGKSYDGVPIVSDFSILIRRGDRIGIVGPNGSGKTTLLNLLTGSLETETGSVRLGANIELASLDQRRAELDDSWTLKQALTFGGGDRVAVGGKHKHVVAYMKDFLFAPEQAGTPISALSGGERGRLMLARAFATSSNFLVLDEPTNDLDLETLDLLQEMLGEYSGTVLLVSHDRDFLDRVVTSVVTSEGQGQWREYAGGYSFMVGQRAGRAEMAEHQPSPTGKQGVTKIKTAKKKQKAAKLSFKDKHALEQLPGKISRLEKDIGDVNAVLGDPDLFTGDPTAFAAATAKLAALSSALTDAEEEWMALEMLREDLEETDKFDENSR